MLSPFAHSLGPDYCFWHQDLQLEVAPCPAKANTFVSEGVVSEGGLEHTCRPYWAVISGGVISA